MLILSRKVNEVIMIGDEIKITVLSIAGKQTRVGIEVPDGVSVHRLEVFDRIKAENEQPLHNKVHANDR